MGNPEEVEVAACRECHRDQCPLHCEHLEERLSEKRARKEASGKSESLNYLEAKGGQSG